MFRYSLLRVWVLLAAPILTGCGGGEPYQPMTGTVTVDGQPLSKGVITFYPSGPGTTVGGEVIDGRFELAQENGATPGKYRVEILAYKPSGKSEFDVDLNAQVPTEIQYLPPKYNVRTTLEAEVVAGEPNDFDFALQSK